MVMTFVTMPITAYAWDWGEFFGTKDIDVQKTMAFLNNDWIQYANFIGAIIQSFEGAVIKILLKLVSLLEGLIPDTFSLFDLLQNAGLNEFATSIIKGLFFALLVLVLTYLGLRTMIFHKPPRFKSVGINIIVMVGLLGGLNELMVDMQKMSIDFYKASTDGSKTKDGLAWELVKHNTADLLYLSQSGFDPIMGKDIPKNNLTKDDFLKADLGDLLTVKVMEDLSKGEADLAEETKFLTYKLTHTGKEATVTKIEKASAFNPFKDSFESGYVRYPMNFWINFFSLLSLGVAYLFTLFVFVMTIFELGMKKIIAPLVFVTDLETGQKTKMVLKDIGSAFLTLAFTGLSLRFYSIAVNYLGDAKLNPVLYVVAMICLTIALIKGSESIMKYFGVDVGLKEGKNNLMAAVGTVASVNGLRKGATNFGKNMKDKFTGGNGQTRDNSPKRSGVNENELNELGTEENNVSTSRGSGRKGMVRNVGATLGYARNRGAGGMLVDAGVKTMDAVSGALDKGKEKASNVASVASDTVENFKSGQAEGHQMAQQNADRDNLGKVAKGIIKNANSGRENVSVPVDSDANTLSQNKINGGATVPNVAPMPIDSIAKPVDGVKSTSQTEKREFNVEDSLKTFKNTGGENERIKTTPQNTIREINVQESMNQSGKRVLTNDENTKNISETMQRDLSLRNTLRDSESISDSNAGMRMPSQNVQREVSMQDRMNNKGVTESQGSKVNESSQTVRRDVNMQNNVRGSESVNSSVKAGSTAVQRDVNVQNNVRGSGAVNSDVKAGSTTVQRDVNVQNNVRGSGAVNSDVKAGSTAVQRDVNVQNNVRGSGAVNSDVKAGSTTVQRDVNVQNNVRERRPSGL
ncbi:pLS20_p028 family conjugation system transmembrane protein, partial [Bacillus cytotoxicus]|uniref:pLS20_p028 family conjugation system transmembrane protein n=1 Tax=Bacillus cytotoxicus TaxID=580165 RepID=UPI003D7DAEAF